MGKLTYSGWNNVFPDPFVRIVRSSNDFHPLARAGSPHSLCGGELEDGEEEEEEEDEEQIRVANLPVIMAPAFVYLHGQNKQV